MQGTYLLAEFYRCQGDSSLLTNAEALRKFCLDLIDAEAMTILGESFFPFSPQGATGVVLLPEARLAIHTWPENRFVSVTLFSGYYSSKTRDSMMNLHQAFLQAFSPEKATLQESTHGSQPESGVGVA